MARIPIMTSRRPMQRPSPVYPPSAMGTEVSEAVGGFARTVGKVADDWATKKAETEGQSEYVANRIEDAENQAEFFKTFQDDPNPRENVAVEYENFMQGKRKDYIWNRDFAKKRFGSTSQLSDVSAIQKLNNLERHKFIGSIRTQGNLSIKRAIELGNKELLKEAFIPLDKAYSDAELDIIKADSWHDFVYKQVERALAINPDADLSKFDIKLIKDEVAGLKTKAKKAAIAEANRLKTIQQDEQKKQQAELGKNNIEKLHNKTLTWDEVQAQKSILTEGQFKYFEKAVSTVPPEKSDPKVKAELYLRLGLGLLTPTNIMNAYGKLNDPDMKELERRYATREKNEWGIIVEPNKYQVATKEVDETLSELVKNDLMSKQDMEEARTNVITKLFNISREKNLADDEILEQKEKLMLPYYKKQSPLLNDDRLWNDFLTGRKTEQEKMETKIKELELSIEEEPIKKKPAKKEKREIGDIVTKGGKSWKITEFDTDGEPLVEEVK